MSHTQSEAFPFRDPIISNFRLVKGHPYLRALADLSVAGFVLRGIKLEEGIAGKLYLGFPGRKVQGHWQLVCESENETARERLLSCLTEQYHQAASSRSDLSEAA